MCSRQPVNLLMVCVLAVYKVVCKEYNIDEEATLQFMYPTKLCSQFAKGGGQNVVFKEAFFPVAA